MKRLVLIGIAIVAGGACGTPSGLTTPTSSAVPTGGAQGGAVGLDVCPSPTPAPALPFAIFGHAAAGQGCGTSGPPNIITPAYSVSPSSGNTPLNVVASMCGSSDTDPAITLHYSASYGDGGPDDGSDKTCKFSHQYTGVGTFSLTECVWDEIPSHAPGLCKILTVTVNGQCTVTFSNAFYDSCVVTATVSTSGTAPSCGAPVDVGAFVGSVNSGSPASQPIVCPPGAKGCNPVNINVGGNPSSVTLKGLNAAGSLSVSNSGGCS